MSLFYGIAHMSLPNIRFFFFMKGNGIASN